jgi:hypothetical protein
LPARLLRHQALAQLGNELGNGGTTYSSVARTQDRSVGFMPRFVELTRAEIAANAALLASLGLAEEAKRASSLSEGFVAETTPGKVETVVGSAAAAHQQGVRKLAARPALDDANKAMFAAGALALAQAATGYSAMTENFGATKKALSDAGASGRIALFAAKTMPETTAQLRQELKAVLEFAKANNIALAPEVNDAAGAM